LICEGFRLFARYRAILGYCGIPPLANDGQQRADEVGHRVWHAPYQIRKFKKQLEIERTATDAPKSFRLKLEAEVFLSLALIRRHATPSPEGSLSSAIASFQDNAKLQFFPSWGQFGKLRSRSPEIDPQHSFASLGAPDTVFELKVEDLAGFEAQFQSDSTIDAGVRTP